MVPRVALYALCCPDSGVVRYIGKAKNPQERFYQHLRENRTKWPRVDWIKSLAEDGKRPGLKVLGWVDEVDWPEAERLCIEKYRRSGARLLNVADGGDMPTPTREQRAASCAAMNAMVIGDKRAAYLRDLKRKMGRLYSDAVRRGDLVFAEMRREKMVDFARRGPQVFGVWLKLENVSHV